MSLAALGSIGLMLGINEASKLMDDITLSPSDAESLIAEIMAKAEKRGTALLSKAQRAISDIPAIAGSATFNKFLTNQRNEAQNNLQNVEKEVANINAKANQAAADIRHEANESFITKTGRLLQGEKTSTRRAEDIVDKFEKEI